MSAQGNRLAPSLRELPGILLAPALVTGALALVFHMLNLIPATVQSQQVRTYESIETASRALSADISVPAYFPDYLRWPPAQIALWRRPALILSLSFSAANGSPDALSVHQVFSPGGERRYLQTSRPAVLLGELTVDVDGLPGTLVIGKGPEDTPFTQVHWRKGDRYLIVAGPYPPEELLRIAGSMKP